eukprot:7232579-Pyramimonas_sp.AAC.1
MPSAPPASSEREPSRRRIPCSSTSASMANGRSPPFDVAKTGVGRRLRFVLAKALVQSQVLAMVLVPACLALH